MQHRTLVRISAVLAILFVLGAFWVYGRKVEQLDASTRTVKFFTGQRADALCVAAKQSRELWDKMAAVVAARIPETDPAYPKALKIERAVAAYVANNPACEFKRPQP